jgi:hypothetical protein
VNAVMNLRVPQNSGKPSSGYTIGGLSSSAQFHLVSYVSIRGYLHLDKIQIKCHLGAV